ncbi:MAG TPA: isoprenylcysteine carboxylmethyltransferase family protein [Desulfuromonadaceae bacterium]
MLRFCLFAGAHSLFASQRLKRVLTGWSTREPRSYRLIYNLASVVMFAWVMAAYRNSPVLYFVPGVLSLVMYLLQLIILGILVSCVRRTGVAEFLGFKRNDTATASTPRLVTDGWYAVVRHPLYFFSILFLFLNPVMTAQWLLLTGLSAVYFVCGALIEERRLEGLFGDEYRRYREEVPFMIPRPVRVKRPPSA